MAGHYDLPDGWTPPVLIRSPNLGQPRLVEHLAGARLEVVVAVADPACDVVSWLDHRVYLQPLPATRRFVQDAESPPATLGGLPAAACPRLIPLTVEQVDGSTASRWPFRRRRGQITYYHARWVTLRLPDRLPGWACPDVLYNLIHDFPQPGWFNVNFHAVYLHRRSWDDLRLLHASDTHISWRNDVITSVLEPRFPGIRERFVNFNQNLRDLQTFANTRHRHGTLDGIVVTGDLVDYVTDNYTARYGRPGRGDDLGREPATPIDNFELFRDLVVAWPSHPGVHVGDELEVPLFTVTGNHDYRFNEYPLIHKLHLEVGGIDLSSLHPDPIREYDTFNMTEDEACAYEGGLIEIDSDDAATFVNPTTGPPVSYRALINPDPDYVVTFGAHRLIGLDTGPDDGVVTGMLEYLLRFGSQKMFIASAPNSIGFSADQIQFLDDQIAATRGLALIACHAPLVNMRLTPLHLLRETEHHRTLTENERAQLIGHILANRPDATELEKFTPLAEWPPSGIPGRSPAARVRDDGWTLGGTRFMKVGARNPYLGWGVAAHNFEPFLAAIEQRATAADTATLVLTGHTHESNEWVLTRRGSPPLVRYYHDYYLDNTIHSRRPQDFWKSEQIPDTTEVTDTKVVWHHKSPLFIQTKSLGPKPSALPDYRLAAPYGRATVQHGRFGLYDLPPGSYVVRFTSTDRTQTGTAAFDYDGAAGPCGHAAITLGVDVHPASQPGAANPTQTGTGPRSRDVGFDLTVTGILQGYDGSTPPAGIVQILKAPTPVGGALEITVEHGEVVALSRISLHDMRALPAPPLPPEIADFMALALSRP